MSLTFDISRPMTYETFQYWLDLGKYLYLTEYNRPMAEQFIREGLVEILPGKMPTGQDCMIIRTKK